MPAFNFHRQFAALVQSGQKRSTIRADRADGRVWRVATPVTLYSGMRSRACVLIGRSTLIAAKPITITQGLVSLDGDLLAASSRTLMTLAQADGFASVGDFMGWFVSPQRPDFTGVLYQWGELQ